MIRGTEGTGVGTVKTKAPVDPKRIVAERVLNMAPRYGSHSVSIVMPQAVVLKPGATRQFIVSILNRTNAVDALVAKMA